MSALEPKDSPYDGVEHVGLGLISTPIGLHCCFIYRSDNGEIRTLGLAMHHLLEDSSVDGSYRWSQLGLDADNKEILGVLLSRINNKKPSVPYAFNSEGIVFADDGTLLEPPAGRGLTCATFIIAVLRTYAHELIDLETWPDVPRDERQLKIILRYLRANASADHVEAIEADKGARSINPDEVVAAGHLNANEWPVAFTTAREIADSVMRDLGS